MYEQKKWGAFLEGAFLERAEIMQAGNREGGNKVHITIVVHFK